MYALRFVLELSSGLSFVRKLRLELFASVAKLRVGSRGKEISEVAPAPLTESISVIRGWGIRYARGRTCKRITKLVCL